MSNAEAQAAHSRMADATTVRSKRLDQDFLSLSSEYCMANLICSYSRGILYYNYRVTAGRCTLIMLTGTRFYQLSGTGALV